MAFLSSTLYYAAAVLNIISITGHYFFGIEHVDPAIAQIPISPELALGKATATTAWDMVNGMLAILGTRYPAIGLTLL